MQVAGTLNSLRSFFSLRNCRQQKRGKNSDDGNDHQKFNQVNANLFLSVFNLCFIRG